MALFNQVLRRKNDVLIKKNDSFDQKMFLAPLPLSQNVYWRLQKKGDWNFSQSRYWWRETTQAVADWIEAEAPISLRNSTPCRPKGSPFVLFWDIHFWLTDLKIFLTAPLAPIHTNFQRERAPKKRESILILRGGGGFWKKNQIIGRHNLLVDTKKKVDTIFNIFFWKSAPPPREIPRSAPELTGSHLEKFGDMTPELTWGQPWWIYLLISNPPPPC